jgi:HSP20 family molecular chaperone IbpA
MATNPYGAIQPTQPYKPPAQTYAQARARTAVQPQYGASAAMAAPPTANDQMMKDYPGYVPPPGTQQPTSPSYTRPYDPNDYLGRMLAGGVNNASQLGAWTDEKTRGGLESWSAGYLQPMLQASQNAQSQQFTEDSWLTNFKEQQYLNQNQVGLDWAANSREDQGLEYAIKSGDRDAAELKRQYDATLAQQNQQFGTTSTQNQYDLNTQRAAQQAQEMYQRGQISLGQAQNMVEKARQEADARYQGGQLDIAQQQNTIDSYYKQGLISAQQRDAATAELKARNEMTLGTQANQTAQYNANTERMQAQLTNAVSVEQNKIDAAYKSGLISVEQKNAATAQLQEKHDYALGQLNAQTQKQLANTQQYGADTERMQVQLSNAVATKQNEIDQAYKSGLITIEQKNAQTSQLKEQHDYALGQLAQGTNQYGASTERMQVELSNQVAVKQNQIDAQYKAGLITVEQKNAQTAQLKEQHDYALGQMGNTTEQRGQDIQKQIAQLGQTTEMRGQDITKLLGLAQNTTEQRAQDIQKMLGLAGISSENRGQDIQKLLGLAQNTTEQRGQDIQQLLGTYGNETDRMRAVNEMNIAQGQLALDQMYKTGQLSTEQYQAETGRLQQQSQQTQWQQQLAAQQSQFGQTLAQQQAELQANLVQQRYNTAGRARNPNYAAWNTRFY